MAATTTLTLRIDANLKKEAADVSKLYGLDLSTAVRLFLTQMVNTCSIPVSLNYEQPNAESMKAIAETRELIANGAPAYESIEDMWKALEA